MGARDPGKMEEGTIPDGCLKLQLGEALTKYFFYFKRYTPDSNSARREQHFKHIKRVWYPCGCLELIIGVLLARVTLQIAKILIFIVIYFVNTDNQSGQKDAAATG